MKKKKKKKKKTKTNSSSKEENFVVLLKRDVLSFVGKNKKTPLLQIDKTTEVQIYQMKAFYCGALHAFLPVVILSSSVDIQYQISNIQ